MYRLTITQIPPLDLYIVCDYPTLDEIATTLRAYKQRLINEGKEQFFVNYDIIQFDEILEDSNTLEDVSLKELKMEGYV